MTTKEQSAEFLRNQFKDIRNSNLLNIGVSIGLVSNNYFRWCFTIRGASDTPYQEGFFSGEILFPENFPLEKPEVIFKTPIYHLNVKHTLPQYFGDEPLGHVSISSLNWWNPNTTVKQLVNNLFALFYLVNPEEGYGEDRVNLYRNDPESYRNKCRRFTRKYANFSSDGYSTVNGWDFSRI